MSKQPVLSPDHKLELDDQWIQSVTLTRRAAVSFMTLSSPEFAQGISSGVEIPLPVLHKYDKNTFEGRKTL